MKGLLGKETHYSFAVEKRHFRVLPGTGMSGHGLRQYRRNGGGKGAGSLLYRCPVSSGTLPVSRRRQCSSFGAGTREKSGLS